MSRRQIRSLEVTRLTVVRGVVPWPGAHRPLGQGHPLEEDAIPDFTPVQGILMPPWVLEAPASIGSVAEACLCDEPRIVLGMHSRPLPRLYKTRRPKRQPLVGC